jgi:hypothetical protein
MAFRSMAQLDRGVIVGVDTHGDAHVAAASRATSAGHSGNSTSRPRRRGIAGCSSGPVASAATRASASKVRARTALASVGF